jgi:hypothetical protein
MNGAIPLLSPYIPSRRTEGQIGLSHPSELGLINKKNLPLYVRRQTETLAVFLPNKEMSVSYSLGRQT